MPKLASELARRQAAGPPPVTVRLLGRCGAGCLVPGRPTASESVPAAAARNMPAESLTGRLAQGPAAGPAGEPESLAWWALRLRPHWQAPLRGPPAGAGPPQAQAEQAVGACRTRTRRVTVARNHAGPRTGSGSAGGLPVSWPHRCTCAARDGLAGPGPARAPPVRATAGPSRSACCCRSAC